MPKLTGKKVAILTEIGFEEIELTSPQNALENEDATVEIVSPRKENLKSWDQDDWGREFMIDKHISEVSVDDYDALLIPGGVMNPDYLRRSKEAIDFTKKFFEKGKPVAVICHGPQALIETGLLKGKKMTSFGSIKTDLKNAGVDWVDEEVVVDQGLISSRSPEDLEAFNEKIVEVFAGNS